MDKKKITIAIVAVIAVITIAISIVLLTKNAKTVHTVSFSLNSGEYVFNQEIQDGKTASKPNDPNKEGHIFMGWYIGNEKYDFSKPVKENITLEAKWEEIIEEDTSSDNKEIVEEEKVAKYTVKFDSNGGSKVASKTVEKNKTVKAPTNPTKEGYTFKGWYIGNTKYNFLNKVTKNITLIAKWEKVEEKPSQPDISETPEVKEYTVKFDVDGKVVSTKIVKEGEKVSKPSNPTKDGYTFKYWSLNGSEYNFSNEVKADITLKAEWNKNDVISYEEIAIENSVANQVKIYVTCNGERVDGTVEMTSTSGKKVTVDVPATGIIKTKGTYSSISNPKVK